MKLSIAGLALVPLALVASNVQDAEACSCLPPNLQYAYNNHDAVLRVIVTGRRHGRTHTTYRAVVHTAYKGCENRRDTVFLVTPRSSAACGLNLRVRGDYLITGTRNGRRIQVTSCGFNVEFASLDREQIRYLDTRFNECHGRCVNSPIASCFADPCSVSSCPEGSCTSNFCGGCNAEWYTEAGYQVCTTCENDEQCAFNQHCSASGQCLSNCNSDRDCSKGHWCRETQNPGVNECVPFQREGETCGGFTPVWGENRCAPWLVCTDVPPNIPDAPGVCRRPCRSSRSCGRDNYCAADNVCREDGTCRIEADCNNDHNQYPHIECVGHGVCSTGNAAGISSVRGGVGRCGWVCEDPRCTDLAGVNFGPCDAVLGYGVVNGTCQTISGCNANGHRLWRTRRECVASCGGPTISPAPTRPVTRP